MTAPLVSVIVPMHRAADTLPAALESIRASTLRDIEIILIDDASPDDTPRIAADAAARDPRIRLLRNPANLGPSATRNRGLDAAAAPWIAFVDADDQISPDWLASLHAAALETRAAIIIGASHRLHNDTLTPYPMPGLRKPGPLRFSDIIFKDNSVVWNKLYSRQLLDRHQLRFAEDLRIGEDLLFNFRALRAAAAIHYTHRPGYRHRTDNPSSIMRAADAPQRVDQNILLFAHLRHAAETAGILRHPALIKVARDILMDHHLHHTPPLPADTLQHIRQLSPLLPLRIRASVLRKNLRQRLRKLHPSPTQSV